MDHAVEIVGDPSRPVPLVITCEHASNQLPPHLEASAEDQAVLDSHWGWDIGAAEVTRELVRLTGSVGVLSRYSRLVCDANRPCSHAEWIRTEVEGHRLGFNRDLDEAERQHRLCDYFGIYHAAVDQVLGQRARLGGDILLLAIHSFTPVFAGQVRPMEIGVIYCDYQAVAHRLAELLSGQGFRTALNEPYSGLSGMVYSSHFHGRNHDVVYQELEIRQDLIATPEQARAVAGRIEAALSGLKVRRYQRLPEAPRCAL
jgi:predicted N-formylglutamate amidohydrolase